jgi:hypothetical protein
MEGSKERENKKSLTEDIEKGLIMLNLNRVRSSNETNDIKEETAF